MPESMITSSNMVKLFLNKEVDKSNKCVCVIVHGLCEHQGRYDYLAGLFHQAGIGTYRFDHRGHGRSEGECAYFESYGQMLDDVDRVVDIAIGENPDRPVFLLGHSMGGFAVALYGAKYKNKRLRGILTSGAATEDNRKLFSTLSRDLDPHMQLPNELGSGVCSVPEVVERYKNDPLNRKSFTTGLCYALIDGISWFRSAVKDFSYPVLMLHGEKDGLVSSLDTYHFFENAASKDRQMKIYGGLFHEIFNEYCRDEVIGDAINWIKNRI